MDEKKHFQCKLSIFGLVVRKPSGRLEAVQLLRVMDDMLDKAGVNLDSTELTGISQVRVFIQ